MTGTIRSALLAVLAILAIVLIALLGARMVSPENRVVTPHIGPVGTGEPPIPVSGSFPFQNRTVSLAFQVNRSVYEGAKNTDKSVTIIGKVSASHWIAEGYQAMISDPAQDGLYRDLLGQFRQIRTRDDLDDDEYLEMITVYVQSMKYETTGENPAKFPVETVVEQSGDCDDKSLLLAGLLSREGYSVVLLSFIPENHMALGIGSGSYRYKNTTYTFLETTNLSYVGVPAEKLGKNITLYSEPLVIPVGNGTKTYTRGGETRYIRESMFSAETKARELEGALTAMQVRLAEEQREIVALETRMQNLRQSGNIREYNALVSSHNARITEYNRDLAAYQEQFSRYERYATVYNYIADHEYDREGVYRFVRESMPA